MKEEDFSLRNFGIALLDFFLPRTCVHCGVQLNEKEKFLCTDCLTQLRPTDEETLAFEFKRKFLHEKFVDDFFSAFFFVKDSPVQSLIHSLKYNNRFGAGIYLGKLLYERGREKINGWEADFILPIPLHPLKRAGRGYNQSNYLAKGVARAGKFKIKHPLVRSRFTSSQTTLNKEERRENVAGAFSLKRFGDVAGKTVIIIDDVITTGSTVSEAAKVLKANGARKVFALSACLAQNIERQN